MDMLRLKASHLSGPFKEIYCLLFRNLQYWTDLLGGQAVTNITSYLNPVEDLDEISHKKFSNLINNLSFSKVFMY